ncbi:MAG TPA: hypothetical protein VJ904_11960 [Tichowtungia sp.]|nr:hypothetical protein [Tichowtungia sp.]
MRKSLIWALVLIAFCVVVFISTGGTTTVEIFSFELMKVKTSLALLMFTGIGVVTGALLK